jgi:hypothetical protein
MTPENRNCDATQDGQCQATAQQTYFCNNEYANNNRVIVGNGVSYAVCTEVI